MKRVMIGSVVMLAGAVMAPPVWAQDVGSADLAVTVAWAGPGTPHVQDGDIARWTVTVTNLGPDTAAQVVAGAGGSDQFGEFASDCGTGGSTCVLGDLGVGESRTVTFSAQAFLIQTEHRRVWWVSGGAGSATADPDPSNNGYDLDVRITGPFRTRHGG